MQVSNVTGIDHIGLTVPDIAAAERFLIDGLGAEFIYETLNRTMPPFEGPATEKMLGGPPGMKVSIIRMYRMAYGPGSELFKYTGVNEPWELIRAEIGPGNRFCFLKAPF